jgi:hypothetical protein
MCGRYRLSQRKQIVEEYFDSVSSEEDWSPRYNIAPTLGHLPEFEGTCQGVVASPLGAHSIVGERLVCRSK